MSRTQPGSTKGAPKEPVAVSVVVPVYNGQTTIEECLDCLYRSTYRNFEVIVVDDGSTDETRAVIAHYPCRVFTIENAGPGAARNRGAEQAIGEILFFLDADILVQPDSLGKIVARFATRPDIDALFGSFEKEPKPRNLVSVYKNLLHHYTHQTAEPNAATFCGGFGAIRRKAFDAVGGFDPRHRFLEDVEMGARLHQAQLNIALDKDLQFIHCKHYTLASLIRSDLFGRAIPWTRIMLSMRNFRNDLNTRTHNVLSVPVSLALAAGIVVLPVAALPRNGAGATMAGSMAALALCFVWLNRRFLAFLAKERGARFALAGAALLWLGYLYSALGMAIGVSQHLVSWRRAESGKKSFAPDATAAENAKPL